MHSEKRPFWMIALGVFAALTSLILFLGGLALMILQSRSAELIASFITGSIAAVISIACLSRRFRTPAIRFVGGLVCVCCLLTFIAAVSGVGPQAPQRQGMNSRFKASGLLVMSAIGAGMAWKGRWPSDQPAEPQSSEYHQL